MTRAEKAHAGPARPARPARAPGPGRTTRPGRTDIALAALAAATVGLASLPVITGYGFGYASGYASAGYLLGALLTSLAVAAMCAAVAWRRTMPVASAVTIYLGAFAHVLLGSPFLPVDVLVLLALYSVTAHGSVLAHRMALGGALLGAVVLAAALGRPAYWSDPTLLAVSIAAGGAAAGAWGIGLLRRTGIQDRARTEQIERLAELDRERRSRLAVSDERARIAREMHDVVAHTLSVVIAQADGGRYAAAADPAAAERALATIAEMGRGALADIRRILGVLRDEKETGAALVPQPVDEDLDRLVNQVRDAGMTVSVVRLGTSRPLPAGAGLMLYRIAQEALTNVLRHAGSGVTVTMLVQWSPTGLVLQVDDDGRGAAARSDGHGQGLVGMRERAAVLGGSVQAGPRAGGGFRVRVELPVAAPAPPVPASGPSASTPAEPTPPPPTPAASAMPATTPPARPDRRNAT